MIANKSDSHKWLQIKVIVTNDYKFSSNINEVIRSVLNFFFFFFFTKRFYKYKKAQNRLRQTKTKKNAHKTHPGEKKSLICLFAFCAFPWLCFYAISAFNAFSACKIFSWKIKSLNGPKKLVFVSLRQFSF